MTKLSFRESMVSMLGEFVALNKSPEFRLSKKSNQFIDDAMRNEYERSRTDNVHNLRIVFDELDNTDTTQLQTNASSQKSFPGHRRESLTASLRKRFLERFRRSKKSSKCSDSDKVAAPRFFGNHRGSLISDTDESYRSFSRASSTRSTDSDRVPYILTIRQ